MVTALCNIYIGNDEKLALFKETFPLVYGISDNWLVYIRGKNSQKVISYIKKKIPNYSDKITFFDNLYEDNWAKSTREILKKAKYNYIYVFLEDHFLMKSLSHFQAVLKDMKKNKIDYFQYSFFNIGFSRKSVEIIQPESLDYFYTSEINSKLIPQLQKTNSAFYPYALVGISSKKYFEKLLEIEKRWLIDVPFFIQAIMEKFFIRYPWNRNFWFKINKILKFINLRLVFYPKKTPFNLEKSLFDCDEEILPYKLGVLKEELFANWDDDNKLSNSSLIKRGLYPRTIRTTISKQPNLLKARKLFLAKNERLKCCYCPDVQRTTIVPKKFIKVLDGQLKITSLDETLWLKKNQSVWIASNIEHTLEAIKDCSYISIIETGL